MTIVAPSARDIIEAGEALGITIHERDAAEYLECLAPLVEGYRLVDSLPDYLPAVKYPRSPGYQPEGEENKYNAWYYKTSIKGAKRGKLAGKRVAIKDNVCVAGVPMMNGASVLEGYTPDIDATVVTRILDAGGEIAGKAHCEYYCFSGGSHTIATGRPVQNPRKRGHTTGGSSSGSAALVAAGEVEMAIGCDQAGSIRIPSSFSGIVGMKPSYGLVPYTGIMSIDMTIDHVGPMTATVADNALLLEVIAGEDGLDPRQNAPKTAAYTKAVTGDASGLRIGVLKEGFGHPNSEPDVDRQGAPRGRSSRRSQGHRGGSLDSDAPPERRHLDANRRRGHRRADDARQRLRHELARPLRDEPAGRPCSMAAPRAGIVRIAQIRDPAGPAHGALSPWPVLRQGAEPGAAADRRLRRGAGAIRLPADADAADQGDSDPAARCAADPRHPARARDVRQHRRLRHHAPSGADRCPAACPTGCRSG